MSNIEQSEGNRVSTNHGITSESPDDTEHDSTVFFKDIFTRRFRLTLLNYGAMAFVDMAVTALVPLMFSTSVDSGGLGLTSTEIGIVLGIRGVTGAFLPFCVAPIIRKHGPRKVFIWTFSGAGVGVMFFPLLSVIVKTGRMKLLWFTIVLQVMLTSLTMASFCASLLW